MYVCIFSYAQELCYGGYPKVVRYDVRICMVRANDASVRYVRYVRCVRCDTYSTKVFMSTMVDDDILCNIS